MRLIDADALEKEMCSGCEYNKSKYANCDDCAIANAPTIDAEPVVHCKDCKWADWYKTAGGEQFCYCIETDSGGRTANDFCSYGERREP